MGLFNWLLIEDGVELPKFNGEKERWQTKDMDDLLMDNYKITSDGRLFHESYETYTVPKEERPHPDANEGSIEAMAGSMGTKNHEWVDIEYHGTLEFHGVVDDDLHSFVAKFTDGELEEISYNGERK